MTEQVIANGKTAKQWVDMLSGDQQKKTRRNLSYLDGQQEDEMIAILNDPNTGRRNWKQKGFIPRFRNLTSMIVEKSGMLFNDTMPVFELYRSGQSTKDELQTQHLYDVLNKTTLQETLINDDQVRRLIKTTLWLYQVDETGELIVDILHRANSNVMVNNKKEITGLIYVTSEDTYRIITPDTIIDLAIGENKQPYISNQQTNPYGIVPASFFYDTKLPRQGVWVDSDNGLVNFNESYNIHLTDSEFTMKWAKLPTLMMIDCEVDAGSAQSYEQVLNYGDVLPQTVPAGPEITGGPGSVVNLISNGNKTPSIQYVGPTVDIKPIEEVYDGWCKSIAQDWSVRVRSAGDGSATSGFQLIVEEIPNQELRKQRQRMFENGIKRSWKVLRTVLNVSSPYTFTEDTELFAVFSDPKLPVDASQQEDVWTKRINAGRATVLDYFKQEYGLTESEAEQKWIEITTFKVKQDALLSVITDKTTQPMEIEQQNDSDDQGQV